MYRLTTYENDEKIVDEYEDEDELREAVESALNDIEKGAVKSFVVSRISNGSFVKPFWEK